MSNKLDDLKATFRVLVRDALAKRNLKRYSGIATPIADELATILHNDPTLLKKLLGEGEPV